MPPQRETLVQLVERLLPDKYGSVAEAGRSSGVTYATWQNVMLRGTVPTPAQLEKIAAALDVPLPLVLNAALASAAARDAEKASAAAQAKRTSSRPRKPPDTPPGR